MQTTIENYAGLNEGEYHKSAADQIVTSQGEPVDWGSSDVKPEKLGLAKVGSSNTFELDIDKVCRLNNGCSSVLTYLDALKASKLQVALGVTLTPMLSLAIEPLSNSTLGEITTYNFKIATKANLEPTKATLQGYVVSMEGLQSINGTTSTSGLGSLSFQLPNSSNGTVLIILFARATIDDRLTAYQAYGFNHLSNETWSNQVFLNLSPLNNRLSVTEVNSSTTILDECYALSLSHQLEPVLISTGIYEIPELIEKSPIVLVTTGYDNGIFFSEYCAYPNAPLIFGSEFSSTNENRFVYTVSIEDVLYKLTITLGEVVK